MSGEFNELTLFQKKLIKKSVLGGRFPDEECLLEYEENIRRLDYLSHWLAANRENYQYELYMKKCVDELEEKVKK